MPCLEHRLAQKKEVIKLRSVQYQWLYDAMDPGSASRAAATAAVTVSFRGLQRQFGSKLQLHNVNTHSPWFSPKRMEWRRE